MNGIAEGLLVAGGGLLFIAAGIFCRAFVEAGFELARAFGRDPKRLVTDMDTYVGSRRVLFLVVGVALLLLGIRIPGSRARQREHKEKADAAWQRTLDEMKSGPKGMVTKWEFVEGKGWRGKWVPEDSAEAEGAKDHPLAPLGKTR